MTILLVLIIAIVAVASLASPWIGAVAYYFLAVGIPQSFWPWIFQDIRASLVISAATILGTLIALASNRVNFDNFRHPQPWLMLLLCIMANLSHQFSTVYIPEADFLRLMLPGVMISIFNKMILFYVIALLLIDDEKKLRYMLYVLLAVTLMQALWANNVYATGEFWRFGDNGRLSGPGNGNGDENGFAADMIAGAASLYFIAYAVQNKALKITLYLMLPFLWHAMFLTGSRAGFLALFVITVLTAIRSKSKVLGVLLVFALAGSVFVLGKSMMNRVDETVERSERLEQGEQLNPRLESWAVGLRMARDNPINGVGVGKFFYVFPRYSETEPHVAHNTTLQFAAEAGLISCFAYLAMVLISIRQNYRIRKIIRLHDFGKWHFAYNETISASIIAVFVMSQFLDMMLSEYFYFLMLLSVVHNTLVMKKVAAESNVHEIEEEEVQRKPNRKLTHRRLA